MTLKEKREALLKELRDLAETVEQAKRDFTAEEQAKANDLLNQVKDVTNQIKAAESSDDLRKQIADVGPLDAKDAVDLNGKALAGASTGLERAKGASLGEVFTGSEQFKAFAKAYPNGVPDSMKGIRIDSVDVPSKALLTGASDTSAGSLVYPEFYGLVPPTYARPLTIRDVITVGQTGTDQIDYARLVSVTNAAAPTAEATTHDNGTKPESSMTFERVSTTVKTIAHWMAATKRALADAGQLRTLVDQFLRYGLEEELEDQVINGDDTGEEFEGILEVDGTQDQAFDDDIFVTIRKALTKVRVTGRATPTGVAIHPADDERIDLAKDANERFYGNGPFGVGPSVIWGVPRVVTEAVPEGTAIVGDWRKAVLWDREMATISATDSHEDFFIKNLVAILAELRAGFGVLQPSAFVVTDLNGS